ncbi:MAG: hypothetical protein A2X12_00990 [Bacteroidetes bacterium GWE2_29_8]|nr:MAG: hypothetical protein A2X12_00990 [Bacteroidetes bacterium GWE2_29_8]OFY15130.1 MAG: hypothetical protein A2X02_06530 [Bacteroidetes bacterium GWF2_29_10]
MCIVIDTNVLGSVFNDDPKCKEKHSEYKPVFDWINDGIGKIVYGGTTYCKEIEYKYLKLFSQYRTAQKAIYINDDEVDEKEKWVTEQITHPNFDDQHIVALLIVSKCRLICSNDKRAYPYFTHNTFFNNQDKPKIYSGKRNIDLLCEANIPDKYKPVKKTTKGQKKSLGLN